MAMVEVDVLPQAPRGAAAAAARRRRISLDVTLMTLACHTGRWKAVFAMYKEVLKEELKRHERGAAVASSAVSSEKSRKAQVPIGPQSLCSGAACSNHWLKPATRAPQLVPTTRGALPFPVASPGLSVVK